MQNDVKMWWLQSGIYRWWRRFWYGQNVEIIPTSGWYPGKPHKGSRLAIAGAGRSGTNLECEMLWHNPKTDMVVVGIKREEGQ